LLTYRRWLVTFAVCATAFASSLPVCLAFAIRVVSQPNFPELSGDGSYWSQEQPLRMHGRQCDVIVFGDSTAATSVDPRVITADTHLSACNLSSTRPVVDFVGMLPVDTFLRKNPRPAFLVLQFGPELFYRDTSWSHDAVVPPILLLLRNTPLTYALPVLLRHPSELTQFSLYITQTTLQHKFRITPASELQYHRMVDFWIATNGLSDLNLPAQTQCNTPPLRLYGPLDVAWIDGLRRKYEAMGISVIIRSAPLPPCDPQFAFFQHDLAGHLDTNVLPLPIELFEAGDRHMTVAGAEVVSHRIAAEIEARLHPASPQHATGKPAASATGDLV